jgi:hypothetical protein
LILAKEKEKRGEISHGGHGGFEAREEGKPGTPHLPEECVLPSVMVSVMDVRHVSVTMPHGLVTVTMRMGLSGRIGGAMHVSMVFIVTVAMVVFQGLMEMLMLVVLGQVEPHPNHHQQKRRPEKERRHFVKEYNREQDAEKRRSREVGASPCRAQIAQRQDKTGETNSVA